MNEAAIYIYPCADFCVDMFSTPLGDGGERNTLMNAFAGIDRKIVFSFIRNGQTVLQSGCTILLFTSND